jgi:hypothetical protein
MGISGRHAAFADAVDIAAAFHALASYFAVAERHTGGCGGGEGEQQDDEGQDGEKCFHIGKLCQELKKSWVGRAVAVSAGQSCLVVDDELRMIRSKIAQQTLWSNPNDGIRSVMHHSVASVAREGGGDRSRSGPILPAVAGKKNTYATTYGGQESRWT